MAFDPELTFILSQNDKGNNPKRPDYRGEVQVGGKVYEMAGWKKTRKSDGKPFVSGVLKLKQPRGAPAEDPGAGQAAGGAFQTGEPVRREPEKPKDPDDVPF